MNAKEFIEKEGMDAAKEIIRSTPNDGESYVYQYRYSESLGNGKVSLTLCHIDIDDLKQIIEPDKQPSDKSLKLKVGDFVVSKGTQYVDTINQIIWISGGKLRLKGHDCNHVYVAGGFRLATLGEIKAGHRIELSGNTGELEVLDMVDVPPTTIVVDL